MTYRDPIGEALDQLQCDTWCAPAQGFHLDDCPLAGAALVPSEAARSAAVQAAYERSVERYGVPALIAPYLDTTESAA